MSLAINNRIRFNKQVTTKNGISLVSLDAADGSPEDLYRRLQFNYPKFFKMDTLCKWAWLGAECLLSTEGSFCYEGMDKEKIAVVLFTSRGCLDVDRKYQQTLSTIPSPALFVYTLSNIMLGEICIRHGFKGEQLCLVNETFSSEELVFWVRDLLEQRGMDGCICGWVDAAGETKDVCMFWVSRKHGVEFSAAALDQFYNN